jgi:hypothetical protein
VPSATLGDFDLAAHEHPRILRLANAAPSNEPRSITSIANPRSAGGPHDFSSEGDYWWPDPVRPNGPYILTRSCAGSSRSASRCCGCSSKDDDAADASFPNAAVCSIIRAKREGPGRLLTSRIAPVAER